MYQPKFYKLFQISNQLILLVFNLKNMCFNKLHFYVKKKKKALGLEKNPKLVMKML